MSYIVSTIEISRAYFSTLKTFEGYNKLTLAEPFSLDSINLHPPEKTAVGGDAVAASSATTLYLGDKTL